MFSEGTHAILVAIEAALAVTTYIAVAVIPAPYGRHDRAGWGPRISARTGWILMESPALVAFAAFYARGPHARETAPLTLAALWFVHYLNRVVFYPLRMRPAARGMPILVAVMAIGFNVLNASVNAPALSTFGTYDDAWLGDPRFIVGVGLFALGFAINVRADNVLFRLRQTGVTGYRVPSGALHDLVANPNYFGEIVEWWGFAIATWSPGAAAFAVYTMANLVPRAASNLDWYRKTFASYPLERRAVFPYLY